MLTPIGKVVAGLHAHGEAVTLTGIANALELSKTVNSAPSGRFLLVGERTAVHVRLTSSLYTTYAHLLSPISTGEGIVPARVTIHGTVSAVQAVPTVTARRVEHAPGNPAGQPVQPEVRLRRSVIASVQDPASPLHRPGAVAGFSALIGTVNVRRAGGRPWAQCTLIGPEDGATISLLLAPRIYARFGHLLATAAAVFVEARLAVHRGRCSLNAVWLETQPGDVKPGTLATFKTDPEFPQDGDT
jgi:hypothetical protein